MPNGRYTLTIDGGRIHAVAKALTAPVATAWHSPHKKCRAHLQVAIVPGVGVAAFKDCTDLTNLGLAATSIMGEGLAHFTDCKNLTEVDLHRASIRDESLAHLKGHQKLATLYLNDTPVTDTGLAHLAGLKGLTFLALSGTKVSERGLAHLKGMPLKVLTIDNTAITDLTPLQGMRLDTIRLTPKNITKGLDILRDMKSLQTIGIGEQAWPAAEFWERYGKGEFK